MAPDKKIPTARPLVVSAVRPDGTLIETVYSAVQRTTGLVLARGGVLGKPDEMERLYPLRAGRRRDHLRGLRSAPGAGGVTRLDQAELAPQA